MNRFLFPYFHLNLPVHYLETHVISLYFMIKFFVKSLSISKAAMNILATDLGNSLLYVRIDSVQSHMAKSFLLLD